MDDFGFEWDNNENNELDNALANNFPLPLQSLTDHNPFQIESFDPSVADMVEQEMQMQNYTSLKTPGTPNPEGIINNQNNITRNQQQGKQQGGSPYQGDPLINSLMMGVQGNNQQKGEFSPLLQTPTMGSENPFQQQQQQQQQQQNQQQQQQQQGNNNSQYMQQQQQIQHMQQMQMLQMHLQQQQQQQQNMQQQQQQQQTQGEYNNIENLLKEPAVKGDMNDEQEHQVVNINDDYEDNVDSNNRPKKRKKHTRVRRACLACRKSHVGCDHQRPCKRCVKKNIPCVDSEDQAVSYQEMARENAKKQQLKERDDYIRKELTPATNMNNQLQELKESNAANQQMITHILNEISTQNMEINYLKNHLDMRPRLLNTLYHKVPPGPWDKYAQSKWEGVFLFSRVDNVLIAFNPCMAHWFKQTIEDLRTKYHTFEMLERRLNKDPSKILNLVTENREKEYFFNCSILVNGSRYPITVALHILPHVWWLHVNYAQASKFVDLKELSNTSIEAVTCPIQEQLLQKQKEREKQAMSEQHLCKLAVKEQEDKMQS